MATVSPECQANSIKQEVVRQHNKSQNSLTYDGQLVNDYLLISVNPFLHSRVSVIRADQYLRKHKESDLLISRKFVKILRDLENQFGSDDYFNSESFTNIKSKIEPFISYLLSLSPDNIKAEATYDDSVFFTFVKNGKKYFLEKYLNDSIGFDDIEMSLVGNDDPENTRSYGGTTSQVLREFNKELGKNYLDSILSSQRI